MRENKLTVVIDRPVEKVFEFTTNPKNTHLWIPSIEEEIADEYPPQIHTLYQNRGKDSDWEVYKVLEVKKNATFVLTDLKDNYVVSYTYDVLTSTKTEMEYFEWMKRGDELANPFTEDILSGLKAIMEEGSDKK